MGFRIFSALTLFWCTFVFANDPPATIPADQYLTFAKLQNLMVEQNATSMDSAMAILGPKYPDYLNFHTLVYASLSLQGSSFEEPRVVVFGPEARFVLTFNGNESQRGGHSFESVEYSADSHAFLYRELVFKYPGFNLKDENIQPGEVAFENDKLLATKPNPAKCLVCHGQVARPIWGTYFVWPGVYGSDDDQLGMSFIRSAWNGNNYGWFASTNKPSSLGRRMSFIPGAPDTELEGLARYAKGKPSHPRYKWLPPMIVENAALKYMDGVPFADLDFSNAAQQFRDKYKMAVYSFWPARPNLFLLDQFQTLNNDRLTVRLEKAGLKNAFYSEHWATLWDGSSLIRSKDVIPTFAIRIFNIISEFKLQKPKPTVQQIEALLTKNLKDEFDLQTRKISQQDDNLGTGTLHFQEYLQLQPDGTVVPEQPDSSRQGMTMIQNAQEFYSDLMGLHEFTELDKIAAGIETDNQFFNTAIAILLADRGIELHDYVMNLAQLSLSFDSAGLSPVSQYLGACSGPCK